MLTPSQKKALCCNALQAELHNYRDLSAGMKDKDLEEYNEVADRVIHILQAFRESKGLA